MRFQETILPETTVPAMGRYNNQRQMWEWSGEDGNISMMATPFPQFDRPPTICYVITQISPTLTKPDLVKDD